jgi:hypothetical protein
VKNKRDASRYPLSLLLARADERLSVTPDFVSRMKETKDDGVWRDTYDFATTSLGLDFFDAMLLADWAVFIASTEDP